ncbi:MAG TPA: TetR/AcrR family transcriptional regulator [Terriglobia bacterium]|nr:TetR/AcrR family transcriptional regulator [Terriglobia bacterium]
MSRSPSTRAHQKVLDAALKLFASDGIDATSMDAIATASGVSKATIYKHWHDKDALCLEVLSILHGLDEPPVPRTGDDRADIIAVLRRQPQARRDDVCSRLMPHLAAYAARNPEFGKAWRASMLRPARIQLTQLVKRAIAGGSLRPDMNLDVSVALLMGPMIYGHVMKSMDRKLPEDMAERVVDAFWRAFARSGEPGVHE